MLQLQVAAARPAAHHGMRVWRYCPVIGGLADPAAPQGRPRRPAPAGALVAPLLHLAAFAEDQNGRLES